MDPHSNEPLKVLAVMLSSALTLALAAMAALAKLFELESKYTFPVQESVLLLVMAKSSTERKKEFSLGQ